METKKKVTRTVGRNYGGGREVVVDQSERKSERGKESEREKFSSVQIERAIGTSGNCHSSFFLYERSRTREAPILFYLCGGVVVMQKFGGDKQVRFQLS